MRPIDTKIQIITIVSTLLGLLGLADTILFYAAGSDGWLTNVSFDFGWYSGLVVHINLFVPGIVVGLGLRTRDQLFREIGMVISIGWILATFIVEAAMFLLLTSATSPVALIIGFVTLTFGLSFLLYSVWVFNVLRSADAVRYFGG